MNNQNINLPDVFTLEERNENAVRKRELIDLVASEEAVLIVGAGSSKRLGYPDWDELIQELEELTTECDTSFEPDKILRAAEKLEYAEKMKASIFDHQDGESKYYAIFDRLFGPKDILDSEFIFHKTLVSLPFKGFLTTNYDLIIEDALHAIGEVSAHKDSFIVHKNTAGQVHRFLIALTYEKTRGVAHLHGIYNDGERIILSSKDYENAYEPILSIDTSNLKNFPQTSQLDYPIGKIVKKSPEWTLHRKLLWAILATRRVVFIGFSMEDPYFEKMLETACVDLWRWEKPIHFTITSIPSKKCKAARVKLKAKTLKRKFGIETLFYLNPDGKHEGLAKIIEEIAKKLNIPIPSETVLTDLLSESGDKLETLEQINQRMVRRIGHEN